jgi:hypothetical protein
LAAGPDQVPMVAAHGKAEKADKDTLVFQPREESGKFGKAVTLHLTGTSKITTLSSRMMDKKLVMVQNCRHLRHAEGTGRRAPVGRGSTGREVTGTELRNVCRVQQADADVRYGARPCSGDAAMHEFQANSKRRPDECPHFADAPDFAVRAQRGLPAWGWLLIGLGVVFCLGLLVLGAGFVMVQRLELASEMGNDTELSVIESTVVTDEIGNDPAQAEKIGNGPRLRAENKASVDEAFVRLMTNAEKARLYEGLPHQKHEAALLKKEKATKKTLIFGDFAFYEEPLALEEADLKELKSILSDPDTFQPWSGCGTYHPDYFIEWYAEGEICRAYVCFGCGEAKLVGPNGEMKYNLNREGRTKLENVLLGYHKNRPDSEGWLNMTKDYKARQQ